MTSSSWWNIYLSDRLDYNGEFNSTFAQPNTTVLIRIISDRDMDGYNDRNEIRLGTDPDEPASHPAPNLLAGYTKACTGNDCTLRMVFQNLGNYDAYGVESVLYSPDGLTDITNNTIGGSGRVPAGEKVIVGPSDTFQYTITDGNAVEPVIVVSYNDPQGNHRFILPATALIANLDDDITPLEGSMLPDPGVDVSSTSASDAGFVINSPHPIEITDGKLFVEYIDEAGEVMHEDVYNQTFPSGPTVVSVPINLSTYPPESSIVLAFFTDSQGNIIDSSARPLASFGPDPLPEASLTSTPWEVGVNNATALAGTPSMASSLVKLPDPWDFGSVLAGTTLHASLTLANTGLGDLRYSLTGFGNGLSVSGSSAGTLGSTATRLFSLTLDTAGMSPGAFSLSLTLRSNDPNHASIPIHITGTIAAQTGTASAYPISPYRPWDQYVYVPGPHNQNDLVTFDHTLTDDTTRMFPLYLYSEDGETMKGVGEYGVDFSGQTAPFGVFGTGEDGNLTVNSGDTKYTDDYRSALASTASSGQLNLALSSTASFANGQEVLVIQIQGTGAGNYEFGTIASIAGNTLTLSKNLGNSYTVGGNSKAQVLRVMQYHDVTVQSGGVLTAHAWDGSTGGIVAFRATGIVNIQGIINANGKGFRGTTSAQFSGESYTGIGIKGTAANGGGGGGTGTEHKAGGGGGGYGASGSPGTQQEGGSAGSGGSSYGIADLSRLNLGSAGGSGISVNPGGNGAGIIFIAGRQLLISGSITNNGSQGGSGDGNGGNGGGSGGSILIKVQNATLGTNLISASGANGTSLSGIAQGGNGGVGRIRIEYTTVSGTTNPTASLQQVNYYSASGQTGPFTVFGSGVNGDLTVANGDIKYTDDIRSPLAATASSGQANLTLTSAVDFTAGQEVLVIQMQGTGVGNYEFGAISSIASNTLTLNKNLINSYAVGGNSKAQVIRVPNYQNVTVESGGILTAHSWANGSGGVLGFRATGDVIIAANGIISALGIGYPGGSTALGGSGPITPNTGTQSDSETGITPIQSQLNNGAGGGGGSQDDSGSGGGGGGHAIGGNEGSGSGKGQGGSLWGTTSDLLIAGFGGGGGGGGNANNPNRAGSGGNGGGLIVINSRNLVIETGGSITANGQNGLNSDPGGPAGGGGGGAGGSILIRSSSIEIGTNLITSNGGVGGGGVDGGKTGGNGGYGRIRFEYGTLTGTSNPSASTQQVNFYSMTGSGTTSLYLPEAIPGDHTRYQMLYGQRSYNTDGDDQAFTVQLPNRLYSSITLSILLERVTGSGSTIDFCLDFGNDGTCDWTATSQSFSVPVRLDSPNLKDALNAYITAQHSSAENLSIPIRVNVNTPADIFLFGLSSVTGADVDLQPGAPVVAPQNGNPADNIPEGSLVDLSSTIHNNGTHKAENFTIAFYQGNPADGGTLIGSTFIETLGVGENSPEQSVVWNTSGLTPGNYTIYVRADASGAIDESDETNNLANSPAVVKKKPDLLITDLSVPDLRQDETGQANVTIKNNGQADVSGATVKLFLGTSASSVELGSTSLDVPEGQSVAGQISFSIAEAGLHPLFIQVDPDDSILEADESNNEESSQAQIGWDKLTVDAGGAGDTTFDTSLGYGWLSQGSVVTTCGSTPEKSYRQVGSAQELRYRFNNLLPDRYYHLDLTLAPCSGERSVNIIVDGRQVFESGQPQDQTAILNSTLHTVSILLTPADYSDGSILLSIQRAGGLNGALVNIIDLGEIEYCYRDSGPEEEPWSAENGCGYDPTWTSDGFNGWGGTPEQTMRFGETGSLKYKFSNLDPSKAYNTRLTFYEGDLMGRQQNLLFDGVLSKGYTLGADVQRVTEAIPGAATADGQVSMSIERDGTGDSIVNEVILEEDSRTENGRYPVPDVLTPPTPTPPTPPATDPQVVLSSFTAGWSGGEVHLNWATTTEIDHAAFKLYRSGDGHTWVETATIDSTRPCGNFTATSPVAYSYSDTDVIEGNTYYYRLAFSGEGCGGGLAMSAMIVEAKVSLTLQVNLIGNGIGTVSSSPAGINCTGDCSENFAYNTRVTLTAIAAAGSTFTGWSTSSCPGTGTCSLMMNTSKTVSATFTLNLAPPNSLQASDGKFTDKVQINWATFNGATTYEVYRANSADGTKSILGDSEGTTFDDLTAIPGMTYYYWVKTCVDSTCSGYGSGNTGWMKLSPSGNIQATDGSLTDKVEVSWDASNGATSYKVYRSTSARGLRTLLGTATDNKFDDQSAVPGVTYYYRVIACRGTRCSVISRANPGWRKLSPPANLIASNGILTNRVRISWAASLGATSYKVFRSTSPAGTKTLLGRPEGRIFNDITAQPGVRYYYRVMACKGSRCSFFSKPDAGWRKK
ncbi:MAG: CARDB domain-containing protein [Chloroflexota bacterium]